MRSNAFVLAFAVTVSSVVRRSAGLVRGVAFWTAVLLPVVYIALVAAGRLPLTDLWVFGKLVAIDVAALVLGHDYATGFGEEIDDPA